MSIFFLNTLKWKCIKSTNKCFKNLCCGLLSHHLNNGRKCFYSMENKTRDKIQSTEFIPFLDKLNLRRAEARRSILVQVQSAQSFKELYKYCNSMGSVKYMFHYTIGVEPLHFIIVEFANESDVTNILSSSSYSEENQAIPTYSQFLWFRASNRKMAKLKQSRDITLAAENATRVIKEEELKDNLKNCSDVSEQMRELYNATKLNDVGTRLRYLTARQIENTTAGMFPYACVYPFGSSVNGYGKMGCDLDLVLRLVDKKINEDSRLVFHCKAPSGSERTMGQRHMESIGDLIHFFLPGCTNVRRILQARVPIIKYHQQLADIECDLSMTNMSGVYMSDFLYIMGELDDRVRPLIFTLRKWAREVGLTNSSPGRWITNFSLTLLVLAFLQKPLRSPPILPSLNSLVKLAGPEDKYVTEDGINCTFLRNMNRYNSKTTNEETLEGLLHEFFEFYSQFDFSTKALCLNEAVALTKPEFSAMYIINPLERGLNVSKNVSLEEVERFKAEVHNAAWELESQENKVANWGILSIFDNKVKKPSLNLNFSNSVKQGRLMEVSTLFEEEESEQIEYKNLQVKQEITKIKKNTEQRIKLLANNIKKQNSQR